ncbi:hypothetical protein LTR85_002325 [Meristemomyces frigidus]|nr:hypothetical protein LTR85_002325 [Meristemomyces frigidus]
MAHITKELKLGLESLFKSQKFSDLTITCGSYSFNVHKAIVCAQSGYLDTACRKGTFKEGESGLIALKCVDAEGGDTDASCDDPEAVMLMVHFFYYQDYAAEAVECKGPGPAGEGGATTDGGNLIMHAKVFGTAIKYQVPGLATLAATKFKIASERNHEHADLAEAIQVVYDTTPTDVQDLRDVVVDTLLEKKWLLKKSEIQAAIENINGLACKLLAKTWEANEVKPAETSPKPLAHACKYCSGPVRAADGSGSAAANVG